MRRAMLLLVVAALCSTLLAPHAEAATLPRTARVEDNPTLSRRLPSEAQIEELRLFGPDVKVDWNRENATPIFLHGKLGTLDKESVPESAAIGFLSQHRVLFKLNNPQQELKAKSVIEDDLGYTHIKFDQYVADVPVWGSQLGVHINQSDEICNVSGNYHPSIEINTVPVIMFSQAIELAKTDYQLNDSREVDGQAALVVFPWQEEYHLCWNVEVFGVNDPGIYWQYFVDAQSGQVIFKYNDIHYDGPAVGSGMSQDGTYKEINTYEYGGIFYLIDATKPMYAPPVENYVGVIMSQDALNGSPLDPPYTPIIVTDANSDNIFDESERYYSAVDAHRHFGTVYGYFLSTHGRNSWDNLGASVVSDVHYKVNEVNAYWNSYWQKFFFGDGDAMISKFTYALDVVAHEFTHAVTTASADLKYNGEPGALNESMSDVFACMLDSVNWTIGEDMNSPSPGYARNMQNPHSGYPPNSFPFGAQPMVMSEYQYLPFTEDGDWGGVHYNSGIPNHAAYLVASQISRGKTAQIYYRALSHYLYPMSIFLNAFYAVKQSALDLYGLGAEVNAVDYAFDSVGIAPSETAWNLAYDDGIAEFVTWWESAGVGFAGEFYLPGAAKIELLSYYIAGDNAGGTGDFYLSLFEDSLGVPKTEPLFSIYTDITPPLGDWISFDLSAFDLFFTDKMYAGMFYDGVNQPLLGKDTTSSWQSWFYNGVQWDSDSAVYFIRAVVSTTTPAGEEITVVLPKAFSLEQNYPNPFNPTTKIDYSLSKGCHVELMVYDILGRKVRTLIDEEKPVGSHSTVWNGADGSGTRVASGVYFYRLRAGDMTESKKMVLLK